MLTGDGFPSTEPSYICNGRRCPAKLGTAKQKTGYRSLADDIRRKKLLTDRDITELSKINLQVPTDNSQRHKSQTNNIYNTGRHDNRQKDSGQH